MTYVLVFLLTIVSLVLLLVVYFYLLYQKRSNQRQRSKKEHWYNVHSTAIEALLYSGVHSDSFLPSKKYQYEALEDTFSDFLSNVQVEEGFGPIGEYLDRHFVPWYREQLQSRSWSTRMNALYFIHRFRLKSMQPDLIRHLSDKQCSSEEKYEIMLLLADFEYVDLWGLMKDAQDLPTFLQNELMGRLVSQENIDEFANRFDELSAPWQAALLEAVRDLQVRSDKLHLLLERLMTSDNPEHRVKSLKTLAALGHLNSVDSFLRWMENNKESGAWNHSRATGEKLMAARLMGSIRDERFLPCLQELIGDQAYSVRAEAARSLRHYRLGKSILTELAVAHPDVYARSIAQEWIERNPDYE